MREILELAKTRRRALELEQESKRLKEEISGLRLELEMLGGSGDAAEHSSPRLVGEAML